MREDFYQPGLFIWRFFFRRFTPDFLSWSAPKHRKDQFIFECWRPFHIRAWVASLLWQRQAVRKQLTGHFSRLCLPPVTSGGKINGLFCAKPLPLLCWFSSDLEWQFHGFIRHVPSNVCILCAPSAAGCCGYMWACVRVAVFSILTTNKSSQNCCRTDKKTHYSLLAFLLIVAVSYVLSRTRSLPLSVIRDSQMLPKSKLPVFIVMVDCLFSSPVLLWSYWSMHFIFNYKVQLEQERPPPTLHVKNIDFFAKVVEERCND